MNYNFSLFQINDDGVAASEFTAEQIFGEFIFNHILNRPPERSRSEDFIVTLFTQEVFGCIGYL